MVQTKLEGSEETLKRVVRVLLTERMRQRADLKLHPLSHIQQLVRLVLGSESLQFLAADAIFRR